MASSRTPSWSLRWLVAAALGGLVVAWLLMASDGEESRVTPLTQVDDPGSTAPTPPLAAATPAGRSSTTVGPARTPPEAQAEPSGRAEPTVPPSGQASAAADAVDWERIPLDRMFGETLGDMPTRQAFSKAMRDPPGLAVCTRDWQAPPGITHVEMKVEVHVRSEEGALVVEDARITRGNVSDSDLERCYENQLRGRRTAVAGIRPGQAFRLEWGGLATIR